MAYLAAKENLKARQCEDGRARRGLEVPRSNHGFDRGKPEEELVSAMAFKCQELLSVVYFVLFLSLSLSLGLSLPCSKR